MNYLLWDYTTGGDFTNAHVDGNLVTAAAWPGHPAWIKKFLDLLGTTIKI